MPTKSHDRPTRDRPRFGLPFAIAVSVLAHVILIVLSLWTPVFTSSAASYPEQQDDVLQFTFAPRTDETEEQQSARGEVPFETEPAPAQQALVRPSQEAAGLPDISLPPSPTPPAPEQPEVEAQETLEEQQQPEELARPDVDPDDSTPSDADDPADEIGTDLPVEDESIFARGSDSPAQRTAPREPRQGADLNSALRNFQRSIDRSRASRPSQPGRGTQQNVYVPDMSAVPVQGAPYGILEFSSRDYDWSDYSSQIYWAILKAWYRRLYESTPDFEKWAHTNQQYLLNHKARIHFVIESDGDVTGISINVGSGCGPLDESAIDALSEVILPPLPADFPRNYEEVNATFVATGEIMSMRQMFRYLRQIGYF